MPSEAPDRRSEGTGSLCDGLSGSVEQAPSTESDRGAGRDQQQADGNAQEAIVVDRGVPRVRAVPLAFQSLDPCVCQLRVHRGRASRRAARDRDGYAGSPDNEPHL